jgi:alkyl hydroperoxide reductase subunit AhpC
MPIKRKNPFATENQQEDLVTLKKVCMFEKDFKFPQIELPRNFQLEAVIQNQFSTFDFSKFNNQWYFVVLYPQACAFAYSRELTQLSNYVKSQNLLENVFVVSPDSKYALLACSQTRIAQGGMENSVLFPLVSDLRHSLENYMSKLQPNISEFRRSCLVISPSASIYLISIDASEDLLHWYVFLNLSLFFELHSSNHE